MEEQNIKNNNDQNAELKISNISEEETIKNNKEIITDYSKK